MKIEIVKFCLPQKKTHWDLKHEQTALGEKCFLVEGNAAPIVPKAANALHEIDLPIPPEMSLFSHL